MGKKWLSTGTSLICLFLLFGNCKGSKHATKGDASADVALRKKYALKLGVDEKSITNLKLYRFIDLWYGVPYKYGGKSRSGVDCSGFVSNLYYDVYNKTITGSAASLYTSCERISEKNLEEGDLVFFKINGDKISHVGVYLQNRKFVHASTHKGVIINSLDEDYYKKYFFKGGRPKESS